MDILQLTLRTQKTLLRQTIKSRLKTLSVVAVEEQSRAVTARLSTISAFRESQSISCYLSMPSGELDTSWIVSEVFSSDKTLFAPHIRSQNGEMEFVKIYGLQDLDSLPAGLWGIKEPGQSWSGGTRQSVLDSGLANALDMILLPGVAFDRSLSRLGHGKGYYDRFITSYIASGRRRPILVGLALREQLLESGEIPVAEHDCKLDMVITPDEVVGIEMGVLSK